MAKSKQQLLDLAITAGRVAEDVDADGFTVAELERIVSDDVPAWEGSLSADKPLTAPDGHVTLSQEDIDARQ